MLVNDTYTAEEFARIVEREHEKLELKSGIGRKPVQETMVAFTNTDGGTILVGATDARAVSGRKRDQGLDDAVHEAVATAVGVGRYEIRQINVAGIPVVCVEVQARQDEVAQTSEGRVLVRQGGHNRALFGRELLELLSRRTLVRFEDQDSGLPLEACDPTLLSDVAGRYNWEAGTTKSGLRERGLLHESDRLTIAGALVLTDPDVSLRASKFHVDVRGYESDAGTSYVRREIISGPVQAQVERATEAVIRDIGSEIVITDAYRHEVPRLPPRVVRETLANAVAHRSYEFDDAPVVVEIRPSSVVVTSPGSLPGSVTVERLREAQTPRNHTVIDVLRRFRLAEDSGQGIDVIEDELQYELLAEPHFEETPSSFRVELPMRGRISGLERAWLAEFERRGLVRPEDRALLVVVTRTGRLTNAGARELLGIDSTEARARLQRLRDVGLVVQHGTRGRAYYTPGTIGPERSAERLVLDAAELSPVSNRTVRDVTGLDRAGALSLLRRLVSEGQLDQRGTRRGTSYHLTRRTAR